MDTKTPPPTAKPGKLDRLWLALTRAVDHGLETVAPGKPRPAPIRPVQPGYMDIAAKPFGVVVGAVGQAVLALATAEGEDDSATFPTYPVYGSPFRTDEQFDKSPGLSRIPGPYDGSRGWVLWGDD